MNHSLPHGPRISQKEYTQRVIEFQYSGDVATEEGQRHIARGELEALIDYRLGVNFPDDKREDLWDIKDAMLKRPLAFTAAFFLKHLIRHPFTGLSGIQARYLVDQYSKVLTREELQTFFDLNDDEAQMLKMSTLRRKCVSP